MKVKGSTGRIIQTTAERQEVSILYVLFKEFCGTIERHWLGITHLNQLNIFLIYFELAITKGFFGSHLFSKILGSFIVGLPYY
jgi:hypothetical protein